MARLDIHIDDKLEQSFRLALVEEGKYRRGEIGKKISELIENYLKRKKRDKQKK